jgi:hypothetical protein
MTKPHFEDVLLAAMLAIPAAYAQDSHRVIADIPFAFTVNNQALPAGEYEVSDAAYGTVVQSRIGNIP